MLISQKIHNDDISNILILNNKKVSAQDNQIFKSELEKFRPLQTRLLQANHKQTAIMKELTQTYNDLLQDRRVRAEQSKYESFSRQRGQVMGKYRKVFQAFNDLVSGLMRAQNFYSEMKETVESLHKNVETFVSNRRSEGGQLLSQIESAKSGSADREQQRLRDLMERMSVDPSQSTSSPPKRQAPRPAPLQQTPGYQPTYNPAASPPITPRYPGVAASATQGQFAPLQSPPQQQHPHHMSYPNGSSSFAQPPRRESIPHREPYNPNTYGPVSPPPNHAYFSPPPGQQQNPHQNPHFSTYSAAGSHQSHMSHQSQVPPGYVPPPPPPGPPPGQQQQDFSAVGGGGAGYPSGPGGYASRQSHPAHQQQGGGQGGDPWAGLNAWK